MIRKDLFNSGLPQYKLWENDETSTVMHYYRAKVKRSDAAIVIFAGGGYSHRAKHEGEGYALHFSELGVDSFVVDYSVSPKHFPLPLLDARRAVRFVRYYAKQLGISPDKIAVMGSSAGGHLAALVSTYRDGISGEGVDEIDELSPHPNSQILCYPVICTGDESIGHSGSARNLLGPDQLHLAKSVAPDLIAGEGTPDAFIWHTANDNAVNVINSYTYAAQLRRLNVPVEMHIFPDGPHGLGLASHMPNTVGQWSSLMDKWLEAKGWLE